MLNFVLSLTQEKKKNKRENTQTNSKKTPWHSPAEKKSPWNIMYFYCSPLAEVQPQGHKLRLATNSTALWMEVVAVVMKSNLLSTSKNILIQTLSLLFSS